MRPAPAPPTTSSDEPPRSKQTASRRCSSGRSAVAYGRCTAAAAGRFGPDRGSGVFARDAGSRGGSHGVRAGARAGSLARCRPPRPVGPGRSVRLPSRCRTPLDPIRRAARRPAGRDATPRRPACAAWNVASAAPERRNARPGRPVDERGVGHVDDVGRLAGIGDPQRQAQARVRADLRRDRLPGRCVASTRCTPSDRPRCATLDQTPQEVGQLVGESGELVDDDDEPRQRLGGGPGPEAGQVGDPGVGEESFPAAQFAVQRPERTRVRTGRGRSPTRWCAVAARTPRRWRRPCSRSAGS